MTTHDSEEQVMSTEDTAQAYVPFDLKLDFMLDVFDFFVFDREYSEIFTDG